MIDLTMVDITSFYIQKEVISIMRHIILKQKIQKIEKDLNII